MGKDRHDGGRGRSGLSNGGLNVAGNERSEVNDAGRQAGAGCAMESWRQTTGRQGDSATNCYLNQKRTCPGFGGIAVTIAAPNTSALLQ